MALCAAIGVRAALAQGGTQVSVGDYWAFIEDAQAITQGLLDNGSSNEDVASALEPIAQQLETITQVRLEDNSTIALDHSPLVDLMRESPPDLERVNNMLLALLAERDNWPEAVWAGADGEQAIESLQDILDSMGVPNPFAARQPAPTIAPQTGQQSPQPPQRTSPQPSAPERVAPPELEPPPAPHRNLFENLRLPQISIPDALIVAVGVVILVAVVIYVSRSLRRNVVTEVVMDEEEEMETMTAGEALKSAQTRSVVGDYRMAVRYLYLATLLHLEETGFLRYNRSNTNREYLKSVAHNRALADVLGDVIGVFERVWYGFQELDAATYSDYERKVDDLQRRR